MDEKTFGGLAEDAFRRLGTVLDGIDPDDLEVDRGGGYLTLVFRDGSRCVINSQRPAREIWMAADATAWHFAHVNGGWVTQKTGEELFGTVRALVKTHLGLDISF